jgi:Fe-S cluster assembly iron-binding protein IscA
LSKGNKPIFAVDPSFIEFIEGSILDFESDIHKTGFLVKENPNAELTCSCKKSFSPKKFFEK